MERRYLARTDSARAVVTRNDEGQATRISGLGAVFYRSDDPGTEYELWSGAVERISPGAFDEAIDRDDVRGLFNHHPDNLLGRTEAGTMRIWADAVGLRYQIDIDPADPDHQRVVAKLERGDLDGSSFSFVATDETWSKEDGVDVRQIEGVRLFDVGPVTFPAYASATSGVRARRSDDDADEARASLAAHQKAEREVLKAKHTKRLQLVRARQSA